VLQVRPDEIYNLAAQSHVMTSFEVSLYTGDVDGLVTWVPTPRGWLEAGSGGCCVGSSGWVSL
jgi:hypothetical protein